MNNKVFIISMCIVKCAICNAQNVSYDHDSSKENQIKVMEIGQGNLTPEWYYWMLHDNYRSSAARNNKLLQRNVASSGYYMQVDDAEKLDSAMVKRAEIEELNVADRSGGVADLAWATEKGKVESKMNSFWKNINRIVPAGGSLALRTHWIEIYNTRCCGLVAVQNAYMPNSERKRVYLGAYEDINEQNRLLVKQLASLNKTAYARKLLNARGQKLETDRTEILSGAYSRWRDASQGGESGGGGGIPIGPIVNPFRPEPELVDTIAFY